ncbi:MAG TPA: glycosyltransferase family 4 protein [Candidatus Binatia bacterium]|nr:glycosyltransferase family 4 protein [Candidatus Binatia bacterium]
MRRRIALVAACPFPSPQGSQVFVGQMAEALARAGHDVHLLTYGQGFAVHGRGYRHHRIRRLPGDDSARSGPTPLKPVLDAMMVAALVRLCRTERIELVHAHNYEAAVAALAARALTGVPVVYHSHNLLGDELETYFASQAARALARRLGRMLDDSIPRRADHAIALCTFSADRLARGGCARGRLSVLAPAVSDDGIQAVDLAARGSLGLEADDFVVGYCGNLDGYQNLDLLLEAMVRLNAERHPRRVRLLLASHRIGPELKPKLHSMGLTHAVSLVEVRGYTEARGAVGACDVLTLPRRLGSGYPIKLLNYMSAGKAVVVAGCGSKVIRDGIDGLVVADDDASALAGAITRCAGEPALVEALGTQARRTYLASMTWDVLLAGLEPIYDAVTSMRQPMQASARGQES